MAINISVSRLNRVHEASKDGLILLILTQVKVKDSVVDSVVVPTIVNSVSELHDKFEVRTSGSPAGPVLTGLYQMYTAEYLLSTGATLLVYPTAEAGEFTISTDGPNLLDIEELDYKLILAPYTFIEGQDADSEELAANIEELVKLVQSTNGGLNLSAQLFLDLKLDDIFESNAQLTEQTRTLLNQVRTTANAKIEVYANSGPANFYSKVTGLPAFPAFGTYGFVGVPASAIAAARKAKLLRDKMPFIPVAGKDNGAVAEITTLYKKLSTFEKEELQANNINVLTTKLGLGPLFVSQNTMAPSTDPYEPLRRSHAVTLALWFKREVVKAAYEFEHTPNNAKSWALLELRLRKLFDDIYEANGLEERAEILLGRATTSANDIKAGKLNIIINFIPVNILREININLNVIGIGETNTIEAVVGGGI
jgi:hypothetical protein